ncbi:hypothetical protein Tco_0741850 [Tanacetum coccineum]
MASYTRPPGFTQPNPQASRPNQGYNGNQGVALGVAHSGGGDDGGVVDMVVVAWLLWWSEGGHGEDSSGGVGCYKGGDGVVGGDAVMVLEAVRVVTRGGGDDGSGGVKMKVVVAWSTRCGGGDSGSWPENGRDLAGRKRRHRKTFGENGG